ncbi:hypothetical protein QE424_001448 [Stenotrophomonas rhizophila]|uniref:DUF6602 domain-containing protein n=1 Tax=Stenotrophomonas rhizophila TaxID=216778 RepID=A0AAP5E904_9GAMM|nr:MULTISPECIES: DUF6602 domain-containing protein [Stenotrophomonas]MDQ1108289.1 hypothetical protein [Stenotrophomonas rhizophila]MDY0978696.1 DUF6602 domain-containing protein [Stenotrophomonas sp. CFBP8994]
MKPLIDYCDGAVKSLNAQFEMSRVLAHSATSGSVRERLIHDFLVSHLPEMTSAVTGVVIDSSGNRSRQQDIVLMLKSMPRLRFNSGHDLIFQEGVVATIEIKTLVTPSVLKEISENISSVKALQPSSLGGTGMGILDWPWSRILHCIVSYGGSELGMIQKTLDELPESARPDIYLDLTKGIILRNEGLLMEKRGDALHLAFDSPAEGLARFLTSLSIATGSYAVREVEWAKYITG